MNILRGGFPTLVLVTAVLLAGGCRKSGPSTAPRATHAEQSTARATAPETTRPSQAMGAVIGQASAPAVPEKPERAVPPDEHVIQLIVEEMRLRMEAQHEQDSGKRSELEARGDHLKESRQPVYQKEQKP